MQVHMLHAQCTQLGVNLSPRLTLHQRFAYPPTGQLGTRPGMSAKR